MRKVLTFLSASLCLAWVAPARAQQAPDKFPDVPEDHWAYKAIDSLRAKGIVIGYPDGQYRGKRTMSRYEFAVAVDRALKSLPGGPEGPKGDRGEMGDRGPTGDRGPQGPTGISPEELATLRRLTTEFRNELQALGRRPAEMNRRLDDLAKQIADLRERISRMPKPYGGAFVGVRGDTRSGGYVDKDGRVNPLNTNQAVVGLAELGVMADIAGGAKFDGAIQVDNYRNYLGGNFAFVLPTTLLGNTGPSLTSGVPTDVRVDRLTITTPFVSFGRGSKLTLGRFAKQMSHLTLWKPDIDTYFDVPFVDDGKYRMDGVDLTTRLGSVEANVFASQLNSVQGSSGGFVNSPLAGTVSGDTIFRANSKPFGQVYFPGINTVGQIYPLGQDQNMINQMAGLSLGIGVKQLKGGHARVIALDSNVRQTGSNNFTGVTILGAELDLGLFDRINLAADWGKSIAHTGRFSSVFPHNNNAFNVNVGYGSRGLRLSGGYRYIDSDFYAPGYWGRIGNWLNPTNIQGPTFRASYGLMKSLSVNLGGDFYTAARSRENMGGLGRNDEITRALAGVKWNLGKSMAITADWEGVFWKLQGAHFGIIPPAKGTGPLGIPAMGAGTIHPTENYVTIGTGYNLTSNTVLKLAYQIGAFDGHGALTQGPTGTRSSFNAITAQAAVKF